MTNSIMTCYILLKRILFLRVYFLRIVVVAVILFIQAFSVSAQDEGPARRKGSRIIDDTTKQVYGPTTSRYFYESDVFFNREILHPLDTAINNYHRFTFVQRYNYLYQDLGNIGTASRPIFYQTPDLIGATSGFQQFDLYWLSEQVKYFNTKSPYSNVKVIIGGKGRSITAVNFSRNINPRWNFGFDYRGLFIDKQVLRTGKGDRNVKTTYYDLYTTYQSKDSTYRLFANFRRHHYASNENGGVSVQDSSFLKSYFYANAQPFLTTAQTFERRLSFHIFQQYNLLKKGIQVYHILDSYRQANYFFDKSLNTTYFGDVTPVDSTTVSDKANFISMRNEVGFKGNLAKLFYNGYYAIRQYNMEYKYLVPQEITVPTKSTEHYIGGKMSLFLDSIGEVNAALEIQSNGNFKAEGSIKSRWFDASLKQLQYAPGLLYQAYRGSHNEWNNDFDPVQATQINGNLHYNSRVFTFSPGITFTRLYNYVYFKYDKDTGDPQVMLPVQSNGTQVIASPEINLSLTMLRHIRLSGQGIYSELLKNEDDVISIPKLFVNGQLSYSNIFFNGNMDMHGGVDMHWQSDYYALGYTPSIQQFFRQNTFKSPAFPIIDVFFNMKVKSGRIFVKYNNVMQAFTKSGYFPTPYYPGQRNVIDFGFDLLFYD
ncbi:MAG TPA: putative porin [Cyclobacteriaceae bacterium]